MKLLKLFFILPLFLIAQSIHSQGLNVKNVNEVDGQSNGDAPRTSCFDLDISFQVCERLDPLSLQYLDVTAENSTITTFSSDPDSTWIETINPYYDYCYIYTKRYRICFDTDPSNCSDGDYFREESVYFVVPGMGKLNRGFHTFTVSCGGISGDSSDFSSGRYYSENEISQNVPNVNPNPVADYIYINNLNGGEEVKIFSITGKQLKSIKISKDVTRKLIRDISNVPSGINILVISSDDIIISKMKFLKI